MTRRTGQVSSSLDLELSASSVANVVRNVAALAVSAAIRRRILRMRVRNTKRGGSLRGRTFQARNRRSVHGIYLELGEVYFRRAHRMKYRTFKRLATRFVHTSRMHPVRKILLDFPQMDLFHWMSDLHVQFDGLPVDPSMTS